MRVSLLYNEDAGEGVSAHQIRDMLERHGHELVRLVQNESDIERLFEERPELVVAAGGDGTVSVAARAVAGRGTPLAILPLGTANNIAMSLGSTGSIDSLIQSWDLSRRQPLDLGIAYGPWGERRFVEGVGGGLIPAGIAAMDAHPPPDEERSTSKLAKAVEKYREVLSRLKPRDVTMRLDGIRISGDYLLVEVLNIRSVGPNLVLSPDANPSDGFFCVVMVSEQHREELTAYLQHQIDGRDARVSLDSERARHVEIQGWDTMHVDDEVLSTSAGRSVSIRIQPAALEFLA